MHLFTGRHRALVGGQELHCKDRNPFFVIKGPKVYLITTFII